MKPIIIFVSIFLFLTIIFQPTKQSPYSKSERPIYKKETVVFKCLCLGISEDDVLKLVERGYSIKRAYELLGVGSECGICIKEEQNADKERRQKIRGARRNKGFIRNQ